MPRETSAFSVSEQKPGSLARAVRDKASGAPKSQLFFKADIISGVLGQPPCGERTLLDLKPPSSLTEGTV